MKITGKMIDDILPENAYFMQSNMSKKGIETKDKPVKKPLKFVTEQAAVEAEEAKKNGAPSPEELSKYNLDLEKKGLDIEKAKEDIEMVKLKREKMMGVLVPTDLVKVLFASHFKSVTTAFYQAVENLISNIAKRNNLDREQVARIRGELIKIINDAVEISLDTSKRELKHIVNEYSQKRGKGERE